MGSCKELVQSDIRKGFFKIHRGPMNSEKTLIDIELISISFQETNEKYFKTNKWFEPSL